MIDLHCHILPGVDDGAKTLADTFAMARKAVRNGVHTIVGTPHTLNGLYNNTAHQVGLLASTVQQALSVEDIPIKVFPGAEVHACPGLVAHVKKGCAGTINNNGKYILLELPPMVLPSEIKEEIFALKLYGITPIIAHPERNLVLQKRMDILEELVRMGVLCQVTAASIIGDFGRVTQGCAEKMIAARLVHVLASDAHSERDRPPYFDQAVEMAAVILSDPGEAEQMVIGTPAAILSGAAVEPPEPRQPGKKKWFSFLGRH